MGRPSDIIVVGAGIVGCAVAHELARRGASVEIVDDRPVGMGATQASAGVLAPYPQPRSLRRFHRTRVGGIRGCGAVPADGHAQHRDERRRDARP